MSKKKTHEEYVDDLKEKNPTVEVISRYIDSHTKIEHHCLIHDVYWGAFPGNVLKGRGCQLCRKERISTANTIPEEEYINKLELLMPHIHLSGSYINMKTPVSHYCKIHDYFWETMPEVVLRGCGCKYCGYDKIRNKKIKSNEQYIDELLKINTSIVPEETYIDAKTKIMHRCLIDNYQWPVSPDSILRGSGCPSCANLARKTHEQYVDEVALINKEIEVLEQYINAKTKIKHKCLIDNCIWRAAPNHILEGSGCPQCNESIGERLVRQWLQNNSIAYIRQKSFDDCRDALPLPFDFYLPDYNICIEYDGKQHFEPVDFGGEGIIIALQKFKIIQRHDAIKNKYCEDNNIPLLRIPYFKNIEEELNNFLIHLI